MREGLGAQQPGRLMSLVAQIYGDMACSLCRGRKAKVEERRISEGNKFRDEYRK